MDLVKDNSIIYIDMDDTICDYSGAHRRALERDPSQLYPQSVEGFFEALEPLEHAISSVNQLRDKFEVYILTAPSYQNPLCYTEKRLWIEKHFELEFTKKLIICSNKSLLNGHFLIDDHNLGKGQEYFSGTLIQFGSHSYPDWISTLRHFGL